MASSGISKPKKENAFTRLYNFREEKSRGRAFLLIHLVCCSVASNLTTGIFYTAFLTLNGIDIVETGILAFVPYIAQLVYVFSPHILQHFPRRRWILFAFRFIYYTLLILGVTVMPNIVTEPGLRMRCFIGLVLVANIVNSLGGAGYSDWHTNFVPEGSQADYFTFNAVFTTLIGSAMMICSSLIADALSDSVYADTIIVVLRYIGYVFALGDSIFLLFPKEYPYQETVKPKLANVITLPFKQKKFLCTMGTIYLHQFIVSITAGVLNYHLLNAIGVSYTYIYIIALLYTPFLMLLLPFWRKQINKKGHVRTFAFVITVEISAQFLYAFVTRGNYLILLTIVRFIQHFTGTGGTASQSNFLYMNMPSENRTCYFTFHLLCCSFVAFLGTSLGTWFVAILGDATINVFRFELTAVPMLMIIESILFAFYAFFLRKVEPYIMPDSDKRLLKTK